MVLGGYRSAPRRSEGMEEFANILQRDYGLKPQGKAAPMAAARGLAAAAAGGSGENGRAGSGRNGDGPDGLLFSSARPPARASSSDHLGAAKAAAAAAAYDDAFGGPPLTKYTSSSSSSRHRLHAGSGNADDIAFRVPPRKQSSRARSSNSPAFHRPLYDDEDVVADVGVPGARTSPADLDDVFRGGAGAGPSSSSPVDELLGGIEIAAVSGGSGGGGGGFVRGVASVHAAEPARANNRNAGSQSSQHADNVHPFEVEEGAGNVDPIIFLWQQQSGRTASDAVQSSLERAGSPDTDGSDGFGAPQLARSARSLREQRRQSVGSASQPISREGSGNFPAPFSSGHQSAFLDTERRQTSFEPGWVTIDDVTLKTAPSSQPPPARRAPRPGRMRFGHFNGYPGNVSTPESMDQNSGPSSRGSSSSSPSGPAVASDVMAAAAARGVEGLEEFVSGVLHKSGFNTSPEGELETGHVAAGAPTEMRDAMERAEVKIRLAKEAREKGREEKQREAMIARALAREKEEREAKEERERERLRIEQLKEREREREKDRAAERAAVEVAAAERAATEAREKAEKAAVEKVNAEARERAVARAAAEKAAAERAAADRAASEKAAADAHERMERERAKDQQRMGDDFHKLFSTRANSDPQHRPANQDNSSSQRSSQAFVNEQQRRASSSTAGASKGPSTINTADDWTSLFNPPAQEDFQEVDGEAPDRRKARWERHQRTMERAAKALAEKNQREFDMQREQAEKHRAGEVLDAEIRKWASGKEGNLRALLSSLQYVLWPECGWQQVSLTDLITAASVKKIYRKATLCVHPDKVQQKGATVQQKYIAEKVFDLLKEAWNKFSSEELF